MNLSQKYHELHTAVEGLRRVCEQVQAADKDQIGETLVGLQTAIDQNHETHQTKLVAAQQELLELIQSCGRTIHDWAPQEDLYLNRMYDLERQLTTLRLQFVTFRDTVVRTLRELRHNVWQNAVLFRLPKSERPGLWTRIKARLWKK